MSGEKQCAVVEIVDYLLIRAQVSMFFVDIWVGPDGKQLEPTPLTRAMAAWIWDLHSDAKVLWVAEDNLRTMVESRACMEKGEVSYERAM